MSQHPDLGLEHMRARADCLDLAEVWRGQARQLARRHQAAQSLFYYRAADDIDRWANERFGHSVYEDPP
jgi:hypothetical protein